MIMDFINGFVGSSMYLWIAGIVSIIVAVLGAYFKGGSNAKTKLKVKDLEHSIDLGDQANDARKNSAADTRTGDERLRERNKLRD